MKKMMSFRIDGKALEKLTKLVKATEMTKTAIIELGVSLAYKEWCKK